jgi:GNAT superfamily N-acetyltransferase
MARRQPTCRPPFGVKAKPVISNGPGRLSAARRVRSGARPARYCLGVIWSYGTYELDDDPARVDVDAVWDFLSTEAYWGKSRTRLDFEAQLATAWRVVGAYETATGRLVGFARAISDGVAYGYLSDVFVLPDARGTGLGKELVATTIDRGPGAHFRWSLHTSDAHGLYRQFGFAPPDARYLERPSHP